MRRSVSGNRRVFGLVLLLSLLLLSPVEPSLRAASGQDSADMDSIQTAVDAVKPALVRIQVVSRHYSDGREVKYESSGSGVVITPEGHVVTNHHVAGHAKSIRCIFADKSEYPADLVGTDPMSDIAVLKLRAGERTFPVARFGDSGALRVGQHVLAMGSPMALSQSVTLGVISNTEMILPSWAGAWGGLQQDGEDVGSLVVWIGHDAEIHGGNSGGPLVNLAGEVIGINEIKMGLGGAIPANLVRDVAQALMAEGRVRRAWIGVTVQPRLVHGGAETGVLIGGTLKGTPAEKAGLSAGDRLLSVNGQPVDVQFREQVPDFNRLVAALPIGEPAVFRVDREGESIEVTLVPEERERVEYEQVVLKEWGITARNLSYLMALQMRRDSRDGVLVTSIRAGGPVGEAKPYIAASDVIVSVNGQPVARVEDLETLTRDLVGDRADPVPLLVEYERQHKRFLTVVKAGLRELTDPSLDVRKAWLPVETQVITRDIADLLKEPGLTGFRITHVYAGTTAEAAGLQIGDLILALDGETLHASQPEHLEELETLIRQYRPETAVELTLRRGGESLRQEVELALSPRVAREMKKFKDEDFELTVRDITFFDKANEQWTDATRGVLVEEVRSGSWAALAGLQSGDLIVAVDGAETPDVDAFRERLEAIVAARPPASVFRVIRGIQSLFVEIEPEWDHASRKG